MGIADPGAALEKLREFRALLVADERDLRGKGRRESMTQLFEMQPLIESIARELDPDGVERLKGRTRPVVGGATWSSAIVEVDRLIGTLEKRPDFQRIFDPPGPTLAASGLHPWVWHAVVNLWDGGHCKEAVNAAASAVEEQTQLKLRRGDLSGADLYTQAFKAGKVGETPDGCRLRFKHLDELTEDGKRNRSWVSAHEGAMHYGRGCAQGIRNLNAHGTGGLPEQEALEYLASLSVLARWVAACEPVPAGTNSQA